MVYLFQCATKCLFQEVNVMDSYGTIDVKTAEALMAKDPENVSSFFKSCSKFNNCLFPKDGQIW